MAETATVPHRGREQGYEPEDIRVRAVLIVAVASLILLALIFFALIGMLRLFAESYPRPVPTGLERRASSRPRRDCNRRRRTTECLSRARGGGPEPLGMGRPHSRHRTDPIEQAMALLAERGWPQRHRPDTLVPPRAVGGQDASPAEASSGPGAAPSGAPRMSRTKSGRRRHSRKGPLDEPLSAHQGGRLVSLTLFSALSWPATTTPKARASDLPDPLAGIGIEPRLGIDVPADLAFRDENAREVRLSDYLGRRPVILAPVYYACPTCAAARSPTSLSFGPSAPAETMSWSPSRSTRGKGG